MAATVVQSGTYLLELDTGWNWNGFRLGDYATKVTRTNLVTNPSFETNATGWAGGGSTSVARSSTFALYGSASLAATATAAAIRTETSTDPAVTAGNTYTWSVWVRTDGTNVTDGYCRINWRNSGGTIITSINGTKGSVNTSWTRFNVTGTAPALTATAEIIWRTDLSYTATVYLDGALLEETSDLRPYFDGSYSEQWVGYDQLAPTSWTGTSNASTSTGQWGLISSATGNGVLDGTTYILDGTAQYADITDYVTDIRYRRGRRKVDDQFSAGVMSFTMNDETGILGPYDTSSPYYDPDNDKPGLAPMRRIRLSRDGDYLFVGYVTSYTYNFALAGFNTVNVTCSDDFYLLAQTQMAAFNPSPELSGARVSTVLALPEVDYTGTTNIETGTVNLGHDSSYNVAAGTNTLQYLNQINEAEQGRLFMSRDGVLTFQNRIGATLSGSVITFADDGTAAKYDEVEIEFDADGVINRAYVEGLNNNTATAEDLTSQATYFIQSRSITNSLLHDAAEITALANYLIEGEPGPRFTALSTHFGLLTDLQRTNAATVEIGDTITVTKDITGLSTLTSELSIEGIDGTINVNTGHRVTYYTAPTTVVFQLILDDLVYGQLDGTNVLG